MPLVRFHVPDSISAARVDALCDAVHEALVETINIPQNDRFHVVHRHDAAGLRVDPSFPDLARSAEAVIVEITFRIGRTDSQKQALFAAIVRRAGAGAGIAAEDVMTVLTENTSLDWSFGGGVAQYAPVPS